MVNSASASLADFKSKRLGTLLAGSGSSVDVPMGGTMMESATSRMARLAPKKSSTAFMDSIRDSGKRTNSYLMQNIQQKQQRATMQRQQGAAGGGAPGYQLPPMGGGNQGRNGPRGANGLTIPAENALKRLGAAYQGAGFGPLRINSGGRTYAEQARLYDGYRRGLPGYNKAAPPGTSLHESGIAVDLGGPLYNTNMGAAMATRQHQWMRQNAAKFGWYWVGQRYGESWHWEYHPTR